MPTITEVFDVQAQGIGRSDYSSAVEISTEPFITSWQSVYSHSEFVNIPANGNTVVDIPLTQDLVVILYDFFASIPANRLIRLVVQIQDTAGAVLTVVDEQDYQTVVAHISKGAYSINNIRFVVYNFSNTPENDMVIGCAGMYTTLQQFTLHI